MARAEFDGPAPLAWVGPPDRAPDVVNVGDALSPFLLAMVSGREIRRAAFEAKEPRISAIGTIGQNFSMGVVHVWGTGCSPWRNPSAREKREPYVPPAQTDLQLHATRGPFSAKLLSGGGSPAIPFGDPAALLPRFYRPRLAPKWELGVVLHLVELDSFSAQAQPQPDVARFRIPDDLAGAIRLIPMTASADVAGVRGKIDEILSCRRIISTSLHGYAIALAYGLPCLYFPAIAGKPGLIVEDIDDVEGSRANSRFFDLLGGYGEKKITYYRQTKRRETDWEGVIAAVDRHAISVDMDEEALIDACPIDPAPLSAPAGGTIWDHELIRTVPVRSPERRFAAFSRLFGSRRYAAAAAKPQT